MDFECIECGYTDSKWLGRCPRCNEWDTFNELEEPSGTDNSEVFNLLNTGTSKLSAISADNSKRMISGHTGFDRLLGGGVVVSEVILFGGPPGVGKSTFFLQLAESFSNSNNKVLFVSGEVSSAQLKFQADRLNIKGKNITVVGSGNLNEVTDIIGKTKPDIVFIDSIQAVADPFAGGEPGSLRQVKKSGQKLTAIAKNNGVSILMSGQITKQGDIAGPKVIEHTVDTVVYMDFVDSSNRILTVAKNRFGSCGDFVLYSLNHDGLHEIDDLEISRQVESEHVMGQASTLINAGNRLVSVELQVLTSNSYFEYPLRRTSGFSRERLLMLSAIVEKFLGLKLGTLDVYLNVSGGSKVNERTSDLAVVIAIYSSLKNMPVSNKIIFIGELGLNGEVRKQGNVDEKIKFAKRSGYEKVVLSAYGKKISEDGIEITYIKSVKEINELLLTTNKE